MITGRKHSGARGEPSSQIERGERQWPSGKSKSGAREVHVGGANAHTRGRVESATQTRGRRAVGGRGAAADRGCCPLVVSARGLIVGRGITCIRAQNEYPARGRVDIDAYHGIRGYDGMRIGALEQIGRNVGRTGSRERDSVGEGHWLRRREGQVHRTRGAEEQRLRVHSPTAQHPHGSQWDTRGQGCGCSSRRAGP